MSIVVPLVDVLAQWWWIAPAAGGVGVGTYAAFTTGRRRARRLALDAALLDEQDAVRRATEAQAVARVAKSELAVAQAAQGRGVWDVFAAPEARRRWQQAKLAQRNATLALRAARARTYAERARLTWRTPTEELPLPQLVRRHDAIMSRWLEYETDLASAVAFPQMTDPRHPATAAFLETMQRAQHLRPPAGAIRMLPADFRAYRRVVEELESAFAAAEDSALRASARRRAVD